MVLKRHIQDGSGLEVLGNKVIDEEEDVSHEKEQNLTDGNDNNAFVINIYELLMNKWFIEIQTDKDVGIIYLLSRYDVGVYVVLMLKDDLFYLINNFIWFLYFLIFILFYFILFEIIFD